MRKLLIFIKNKRLKLGFSLNSGQNKFLTKDQLKK